eukprot:1143494-Pelagomonas_calceolata.AAC.2
MKLAQLSKPGRTSTRRCIHMETGHAAHDVLSLKDGKRKLSPVRQVTRPEIHNQLTQAHRDSCTCFCWKLCA